ncbi:MAG: methyltransferase domain-containing protein [Gemmatimonadota bacterium]
MDAFLVPRRRDTAEILDGADVPDALRERSHRDICVANALFGGTRALLTALGECSADLPSPATFLDIGTGTGEATERAVRFCATRGVRLQSIALDVDPGLAGRARRHAHHAICASAMALPLASRSIDVVACHQVAHHFKGEALSTLLREMQRVARHRVIVSDLRRSWFAAAGLWAASFPLLFHPVSRHDGVLSVLRGFTSAELQTLVYDSCGVEAAVRRRAGFRLTASWSPAAEPAPVPASLPHA